VRCIALCVTDGTFESFLGCALSGLRYAPRRPEETVLYGVIADELETFLARRQERDRPVPRFVEREFRDYLTCGILEHGSVIPH
jgi:hypothetical protein